MVKTKSEEAFKFPYRLLRVTGAWPDEDETIQYKLRGWLGLFAVVALTITMLIDAIYNIADFAKLSEVLYIMITMTSYIFKHVSIIIQRKTFRRMTRLLEHPILQSYPDDLDYLMVRTVKFSTILANVYQYMVFADGFLMATAPIFNKQPLPFPFPYDLGNYRFVMYALQVSGIIGSASNNPAIDSLTAALMGLAATHLEILENKIIRARNSHFSANSGDDKELSENADKIITNQLRNCVEHHLIIIEYVQCVDQIFSFGILMQFLGGVIIICNTLFHFLLVEITSVKFLYLVNYMCVMFTELFLYCGFGHDIIWKSTRIGEACYTMKWYNCGNLLGKHLFIIMERSRRPLCVTVYKFSILSLGSFLSILQWSYSYFALLLKLYNKR